jgi:hypothetical protein
MFLSVSVDSGIGLTAGKLMCGKAIPKSDSTYLTTVKLREKFIQLKKFLSIKQDSRIETEKIGSLKNAINKLQEELTVQKTITETVSEQNLKLKSEIEALTNGQSVLDNKVDKIMTTLFSNTFAATVETFPTTIASATQQKKTETKEKNEMPKESDQAKETEANKTNRN